MNVKVIIPFEEFRKIYDSLPTNQTCRGKWCRFSKTTCYVRKLEEGIRAWWQEKNGTAPGFCAYEIVFRTAITVENHFYWCFWVDNRATAKDVYEKLCIQVRAAHRGESIDREWCENHRRAHSY